MADMEKFDKQIAELRKSVESHPSTEDGITGILETDDDSMLVFAWGESARVLRRVLKLEPHQTPKYIRDSN